MNLTFLFNLKEKFLQENGDFGPGKQKPRKEDAARFFIIKCLFPKRPEKAGKECHVPLGWAGIYGR
jgi:hypothetical protein